MSLDKPLIRRFAALFGVLLLSGCAAGTPRQIAAPAAPPPPDIESLIEAGCYRCLEAGLEQAAGRRDVEFQLAILLGLRAKELGLPYQPWLDRARAAMPAGPEWPLYLEIAGVVRVDPLSGDREEILTLTTSQRRPAETVQGWRAALAGGTASAMFRTYLDLTLACSLGQRQDAIAAAQLVFPDAPLIQYRIGTCGSPSHLEQLRAARADYVDADLPLGRNALEQPVADQEEALRRFRSARAAFPESALIAASIGDVHREREEWAEALEAYDATLTLVPTHRDALLGRTIALSNLARHDEAIATATRLLDLGNWLIGGAYFWRGWNQYNLGNMTAARADVDEARTRAKAAATFVLSGMIAWRQQDLDFAENEFETALSIDKGQCEAAALQGGVRAARRQWLDALASLQHAQQCFDLTIALRRKFIEEIMAGPGSPEGKAGQAARHQRVIEEAEKNRDDARRSAAAIEKR